MHDTVIISLQHIIETATVGTREIDRSKATYSHVYEYLREEVS